MANNLATPLKSCGNNSMNVEKKLPNKVFGDSIKVWLASNHLRCKKYQFRGGLESKNRSPSVLSDRSCVFEVFLPRSYYQAHRIQFLDKSHKWSRISHTPNVSIQSQNDMFGRYPLQIRSEIVFRDPIGAFRSQNNFPSTRLSNLPSNHHLS